MNRLESLANLIKDGSDFAVKTDIGKDFDDLINNKAVSKDTVFIVYSGVSPVNQFEDGLPISEYNFNLFVRSVRDIEETTDDLLNILSSKIIECDKGAFFIHLNSISFSHEDNFTLTTINLTLMKGS